MRVILSMVVLLVLAGEAAAQPADAAKGGSIRVLCNVERAVVSLDGTDVGVAPLEIKQVRPGEHVVAVRAEGHGRREDRVTVEPGATAVVALDLDVPGQAGGSDAGAADPGGSAELPRGRAGGAPGAPGAVEEAQPPGGGKIESDAAEPSKADLLLERRGLTSFGARALPRGRSTVAIGAGYPYLVDSRILVGAVPRGAPLALDAGILFRTYGARWELAASGRLTLIDQEPFSLGVFGDAGGGSTYFDDSKRNYWFLNGGLAASLTGLGAVTITGRTYINAWTDRHCPGDPGEGSPTDVCQAYRDGTLDPAERARVDELVGEGDIFDRDSGVRIFISLAVEIAMSEKWNFWLLIEGAPRQDERAAFTDLFHGVMFEEDARSYARAGFTYKF